MAQYRITSIRRRVAADGPGGPLATVEHGSRQAINAIEALEAFARDQGYPEGDVHAAARNRIGVMGVGSFHAEKVSR